MKDELQLKLVEILTAIQVGVDKGADFALEHLPDIAQQYVLYGRVWSTVSVLWWLAMLVAFAWVALRFGFLSKEVDRWDNWSDARLAAALSGTSAAGISSFILQLELRSAMLVWFAPKVWLLKEVAGLL